MSLLRLLDLDLGEGATLELLRKYNRGGRSDYLAFLQNIKRLLFPRGASPDAERSRDEGEGEEAEVEEDRARWHPFLPSCWRPWVRWMCDVRR